MSESLLAAFKGAASYLAESKHVGVEATQEDQTEEEESLLNSFDVDDCEATGKLQFSAGTNTRDNGTGVKKTKLNQSSTLANHNQLVSSLQTASEGVIVGTTLSDYQRYWNQFKDFCVTIGKVQIPSEVDKLFPNLPADFPTWVALWIMDKCDENDIWTGKAKDPGVSRATYGTAQKMRAAVSHKFGRDYQLGTQPWLEHPAMPGKFSGNPSLSVTISQYMVSLRRRKIRAGEAVMSARAMDEPTLKRLWEFAWSTERKEYGPTSRKRKAENPSEWAGFSLRMMLYLLYLLSMLCLLRYDEALRITWADVTFQIQDLLIENHWLDVAPELFTKQVNYRPAHFRVKLELPFRKTHQYGGIAPFYIYADPDRPWMCLLQAFAVWWLLAQGRHKDLNGFVFRKKIGADSISVNPTDGMTSNSFLECFRNNLLDIGVDPRPYGTHSFRRGGCQFLHTVRGWSFRKICDWGGWAENFDNPGTIFKYLLSWNDNPAEAREHYMNPNRPGCDPCYSCGRTCRCG